jgi:uncharacterized protein YjiS (DUF1127 family)
MTTMAATDTYPPKLYRLQQPSVSRFERAFGAFSDWNDRRSTRKMLGALSDRELDDIGLSRGEIDKITGKS